MGNVALEDQDPGTDWEVLDSRVSAAVQDIRTALEQALTAARELSEWAERIHTLSAFMQRVESGLVEARHQLQEPPPGPRPIAVPVPRTEEPSPMEPAPASDEADEEPPAVATERPVAERATEAPEATPVAERAAEAPEATPVAERAAEAPETTPVAESAAEAPETIPVAEGEEHPDEAPRSGEGRRRIHLEIQSSEANVDLMVVERALRETPGVADVDLLDYAGKRARVRVMIGEGQDTGETATPERLAAQVQERLANLAWGGGLSVSPVE